MERGRSFRILGLSETATKAQVEAAYKRKVAIYKSPNYADESEYADRKLKELYQAYQYASKWAESNPNVSRLPYNKQDDMRGEEKKPVKSTRLLEEERSAAEHNTREKIHQWMERRDEEKKDDLSTETNTFRSSKKTKAKRVKPGNHDFSKIKQKLGEAKAKLESYNEPLPWETEADSAAVGERVTETGTVEPAKPSGKRSIVSGVITIIITIVSIISACDAFDTDDYLYDYEYSAIAEKDHAIANMAEASEDPIYELDSYIYNEETPIPEEEETYLEKADLFAKNYWKMNSIDDVSDYLYDNYSDYYTDSTYSLDEQLDSIFRFYGFDDLDWVAGYVSPYNNEPIEGYGDYLDYLNQFYEAQ